ncbi:RING-type domain-containing protein [Caenorhabditis elegans]|nr:RING-type domain-containing protein [Caenorhabditis elegans]CDR32684.1 RING-type domain-containing protein [Caenorhabditis elegans]|eukprot:NP_001293919.1 Uncharacterized protein CELE_T23F6.3 [Caenorhabditis elegans]
MEIIKSRRQSFRLRQIRATRRSHSRQPY